MAKTQTIKIAKGLSIASPWPALLLEKENALLVSDLHIGLEDMHERKGVHIPTSILPKILKSIVTPAKELGCSKVIVLGDVKHEFGDPREEDWFGVKKLVKQLNEINCKPEVVRGNHDNYIVIILKELNIPLHEHALDLGKFLLTHGHLELYRPENRHVIMGHEHPAVSIRDDLGVKHGFKAFLNGRLLGSQITVLPSTSPLTIGTAINETPSRELLSPILRNNDLGEMVPYVAEVGTHVKEFPALKML
ncbi:MAG: metallophosphoesterase [Thaumarchaeota archaeon]|nr:metallophosphoesterase [Nitrososphaerota archaeon]